MLKAILVVLLLAGCGLYALVSKYLPKTDTSPSQPSVQISKQSSTDSQTATKPSAILEKLGVSVRAMPDKGCTESVLSQERLNALLAEMPSPLGSRLRQVLEFGTPVWRAQLYVGSDGTGVCLPVQNKLVMLPMTLPVEGVVWDKEALKHKIAQSAGIFESMGKTVSKWLKD